MSNIPDEIKKKIEDERDKHLTRIRLSSSSIDKMRDIHRGIGFITGAEYGYSLAAAQLSEKDKQIEFYRNLVSNGVQETIESQSKEIEFLNKNCDDVTEKYHELKKELEDFKNAYVERNDKCNEQSETITKLREGLEELSEQYELVVKQKFQGLGVPFNIEGLPTLSKAKQLLLETGKPES